MAKAKTFRNAEESAAEAIKKLKSIPKNDRLRARGLQLVNDWRERTLANEEQQAVSVPESKHTAESLYKLITEELAKLTPFEQRWFWQKLAADPGYEKAEDKIGVRHMRTLEQGVTFTLGQVKEQARLRAMLPGRRPEHPDLYIKRYKQKYIDGVSWNDLRKMHEEESDVSFDTVRSAIVTMHKKKKPKGV